jgi:hypothetical protein
LTRPAWLAGRLRLDVQPGRRLTLNVDVADLRLHATLPEHALLDWLRRATRRVSTGCLELSDRCTHRHSADGAA